MRKYIFGEIKMSKKISITKVNVIMYQKHFTKKYYILNSV